MPARELHEAFNFTVVVEDFPDGTHFSQCSDVSANVESLPYLEAGAVSPIKDPGVVTFPPVTLRRGASRSRAFFEWASSVILAAVPPVAFPFRREVQIFQRNRQKQVVQVYTLHRAWPTGFVAGSWDNGSDQVVIQSIELTYEYFSLKVRRTADRVLAPSF